MTWRFDWHTPPKGLAYASLSCELPQGKVEFKFNPDAITVMQKSASTQRKNLSADGGPQSSVFKGAEPVTYTLKNVDLAGGNVQKDCEQILKWMQPAGGEGAGLAGIASQTPSARNLLTRKPDLKFTWGKGFTFKCTLKRVRVQYTRFDINGMPTRAKLSSVQLEEIPENRPSQNPTSGGAPGRRSHLVSAGENLLTIAAGAYGQPSYWRQVADLNGIDDPLRVSAGDHLYLPNADELLPGRPVADLGERR